MLRNLAYGIEKSPFILIEDCAFHNGLPLLKCILKSRLKTGKFVHPFCYENSPDEYIGEYSSKLKVHNGYTDPMKWENSPQNDLCDYELCKDIDNLKIDDSLVLLIDSLSYVLLHNPVSSVYKLLDLLQRKNLSKIEQVICLHKDIHDEETIDLFEHLATTVLRLSDHLPFTSLSIHKKMNKIIKETEEYTVTDTYDVHCVKKNELKETLKEVDPTANLTFNLQLRESEKSARENLVLPYTKVKETDGCIYFQPEDGDFEDPDDDLDI